MYIPKVVTVSSTAVIATITASPLRIPGPSDTLIFSVVSPPSTSPAALLIAAVRPISVAPMITVTTTATVTMKIPNNGSPYPAFNASNYPHQNSTKHHDHSHNHNNSTNMVPVMYSNCTNAVPVLYTSGNRTYSSTINPSDPKDPRVEIICKGHDRKNETRYAHGAGEDAKHAINTTSLGHERPSLSVVSGAPSVLHLGPGGAVYESTPPADGKEHQTVADGNADLIGHGSSSDAKAKREIGDVQTDEHVPAYVKALEKGPII